jgi:hypothetical protein
VGAMLLIYLYIFYTDAFLGSKKMDDNFGDTMYAGMIEVPLYLSVSPTGGSLHCRGV